MTQLPKTNIVTRSFCALVAVSALLALGAAPAFGSSGSGFYIRGGGFGHDIGMSQYGAAGFAQHGYKYTAILKHYYSQTTLGKISPTRIVTVLLADGGATFSGATTIKGSKTKLKRATNYGVLVDGSKIRLISKGRTIGSFKAPLMVSGPASLDLVGQGHYRGSFVFSDASGAVQTVNSLGVDDYIRGVVPAEIPASWPQQALEAQAVAARTYAITSGSVTRSFMLYDDTRSQMYEGVSVETSATNAAVKATSGQVVDYDGSPATTYFFASSGGHTKSIAFSWGITPEAWLTGVADPYDDSFNNPYFRWKRSMAVSEAKDKLVSYVKGDLKGIRINTNSAQVVGSGGTTTVDGYDLEAVFGTLSPNMTFTTIDDRSGTVTASQSSSGSGNGGHGLADQPNAKTAKFPAVVGTIFPATKGTLVTAQLEEKSGWKSIRSEKLPASGHFAIRVSASGRYRVLYGGIEGPSVSVR